MVKPFTRTYFPLGDPPTILKRIGPGRKRNWVLYDAAYEDDFFSWWLHTEYGRQLNGGGRSRIKWSIGTRSAEVWNHFHQVAEIHTGRPKVVCQSCLTLLDHPHHKSNGTSAMGRHQKSSSCQKGKKRATQQTLIQDSIQTASVATVTTGSPFTKEQLEEQLLKTITGLRLPFQVVEDVAFQQLLNLVHSGSPRLELPSAKTLRRRLRDAVIEQHMSQLKDLPEDAKVSLALDCWTSPFQQAFMAITAYFIDSGWNYRELLLGFEPLHGPHSGTNLSDVLLQLLKERNLLNRIFTVTTDNATNNDTLIRGLQDVLLSTGAISSRDSIVRVPCMAHVIQLCLKQLLGHIRAAPRNEEVGISWSDSQVSFLRDSVECGDVAHTLAKV